MATGLLSPEAAEREFSDLGLVVSGAKLNTYVSGTPSTPLATYTDAALTIQSANPIVASTGGLLPAFYLTPGVAYKYVLTDALGNVLWTRDPVMVAASLTLPVAVAQGGTGLTAGTSGGVPYFNSSSTMASSALLTQHGVLIGGGAAAAPVATAVLATGQVLGGVTGADPVPFSLGIQDRQVTLQTVANTVTETAVYTYAVPANLLGTNRTLKLSLIGDHLINAGSADSVRVRAKYGATTIFDASVAAVTNGANRGSLSLDVELTGANATNAQRAKGFLQVGDSTQNNAAGVAGNLSSVNTYTMYGVHNAVAEDSTAIKNLVVTIQLGTANALIDARAHTVTTELK